MEVLLRGLARIVLEFGRFRLHVVGPYSPKYMTSVLEPLMSRLGITDHVKFHGLCSAPEIVELMSKMTLLVLPTYMDTSPNVIAESQAAGVPVVASSVGGIPEMIEHGVSGILVESGSAEALANGILRILHEPAMAAKMAAVAQARAIIERNPEVQVQTLMDIYRQAPC
jgi:glycosyltransferase involved in cell wall biosynthesis